VRTELQRIKILDVSARLGRILSGRGVHKNCRMKKMKNDLIFFNTSGKRKVKRQKENLRGAT